MVRKWTKNWRWVKVWVTWKSNYLDTGVCVIWDSESKGTALPAFLCRDFSRVMSSHYLYIFIISLHCFKFHALASEHLYLDFGVQSFLIFSNCSCTSTPLFSCCPTRSYFSFFSLFLCMPVWIQYDLSTFLWWCPESWTLYFKCSYYS